MTADISKMTREDLIAAFEQRGFVVTGPPGPVYNLLRGTMQANKARGADELTFLRERLTELQKTEANDAQQP